MPKTKKATKKDPNAPKQPKTAFFLFSDEMRPKIKEDHPTLKPAEVAKKLGELWGELTSDEKKKYNESYEKSKAEYKKVLETYEANKGSDEEASEEEDTKKRGKGKKKATKKAKDTNKPKKATTAFFFFCHDKRAEVKEANPDMKATDISKELGRMWGELSDAEKKPYTKKADADKERYKRESEAMGSTSKSKKKEEKEEKEESEGEEEEEEEEDSN